MGLRYKLLQRGGPGMSGNGSKQRNPHIKNYDEMNMDDLVSEIEKCSALGEAEIKEVIIALEKAIQKALSEGIIVRLDNLGTLYPSINSGPPLDVEDICPKKKITENVNVKYRTGNRILELMRYGGFNIRPKRSSLIEKSYW